MKYPLSKIFIILIIFLAGAAAGFFYHKFTNPQVWIGEIPRIEEMKVPEEKAPESENQKVRTDIKLNILRDYINFVWFPSASEEEAQQKSDTMSRKVAALADENIKAKFYAVAEGDEAARRQKSLELINFLIDEIKKDFR